jgi:hypothetical protein
MSLAEMSGAEISPSQTKGALKNILKERCKSLIHPFQICFAQKSK